MFGWFGTPSPAKIAQHGLAEAQRNLINARQHASSADASVAQYERNVRDLQAALKVLDPKNGAQTTPTFSKIIMDSSGTLHALFSDGMQVALSTIWQSYDGHPDAKVYNLAVALRIE